MKILVGWLGRFSGVRNGMETAYINFGNAMRARGHEVILAYCTDSRGGGIRLPLREGIKLLNLADYTEDKRYESGRPLAFKAGRELLRFVSREGMNRWIVGYTLRKLRPAVQTVLSAEQPEVIVAMDAHVAAVFQNVGVATRCPMVTMSHFDAESILGNLSVQEREALKNSDAVQVLMPGDVAVFHEAFPELCVRHIPNCVPAFPAGNGKAPNGVHVICHVARLDRRTKRQHLLIEAFARLAGTFPDWNVEFWGGEPQGDAYTKELQARIHSLGLEGRVKLCGETAEVGAVYAHSDILAFPSAHEGFPLSLTEAMSAGLPAVGFRSCPAVSELIEDHKTGILAEDGAEGLAAALSELMEDEEKRRAMGKAARAAMEAYRPQKVWDAWEELLCEVAARRGDRT